MWVLGSWISSLFQQPPNRNLPPPTMHNTQHNVLVPGTESLTSRINSQLDQKAPARQKCVFLCLCVYIVLPAARHCSPLMVLPRANLLDCLETLLLLSDLASCWLSQDSDYLYSALKHQAFSYMPSDLVSPSVIDIEPPFESNLKSKSSNHGQLRSIHSKRHFPPDGRYTH